MAYDNGKNLGVPSSFQTHYSRANGVASNSANSVNAQQSSPPAQRTYPQMTADQWQNQALRERRRIARSQQDSSEKIIDDIVKLYVDRDSPHSRSGSQQESFNEIENFKELESFNETENFDEIREYWGRGEIESVQYEFEKSRKKFSANFKLPLPDIAGGLPTVPTRSGLTTFCKNVSQNGIGHEALEELMAVIKGDKVEARSAIWDKTNEWTTGDLNAPETTTIAAASAALVKAFKANYPFWGKAEIRKLAQAYIEKLVEQCLEKTSETTGRAEYRQLLAELTVWKNVSDELRMIDINNRLANSKLTDKSNAKWTISEYALVGAREQFLRDMQDPEKDAYASLNAWPKEQLETIRKAVGDGIIASPHIAPEEKTKFLQALEEGTNALISRWKVEISRTEANKRFGTEKRKLTPEDAQKLNDWAVAFLRKAANGVQTMKATKSG